MDVFSRRAFLAGTVGTTVASAGCLSGGERESGDRDMEMTTEIGSIAGTTPPEEQSPLPSPVAGDPNADTTVTVFEDYACPHCRTFAVDVFPQLAREYLVDEAIRYEFHDFPIPVDSEVSPGAANAARAVQAAAGPQAYFVYSERLFRNQSKLGPSAYTALTDGLDADGETVRTAGTDRTYETTVRADRRYGRGLGVSGTPAVFVNGDPVQFDREIAYKPLRDAIEAARTK
jgi:protein-disulfide isomerase